MKKIILPLLCIINISLLSGCSLPGEKGDKTEVVIDSSNPDATTDKNIETNVPTDTTPSDTPKAIAEGGLYLPYTTTAVAQAQGQVVLFFHTNWSPASIAIDRDITANRDTLPKDITILMVNYDDAKKLRELYEVTEQPSFVQVNNNGKLIKKWRGGTTLAEIIGQVKK